MLSAKTQNFNPHVVVLSFVYCLIPDIYFDFTICSSTHNFWDGLYNRPHPSFKMQGTPLPSLTYYLESGGKGQQVKKQKEPYNVPESVSSSPTKHSKWF